MVILVKMACTGTMSLRCLPLTITSYLIEGVKNTHMNFPYHTESVSQHVDHFKQKKLGKNVAEKLIIFREGGRGGGMGYPLAENSAKIINCQAQLQLQLQLS